MIEVYFINLFLPRGAKISVFSRAIFIVGQDTSTIAPLFLSLFEFDPLKLLENDKDAPDLSKRVFAMKIPKPMPSYSGLASSISEVFRLLIKLNLPLLYKLFSLDTPY